MKSFLFLSLFLWILTSSAFSPAQKLEIGLNVQYGISGTTKNSQLFYNKADYRFRPSYAAEIQAGYCLNPRFKVGLGLQFSQDQNRGIYESTHPDYVPLLDQYDFKYSHIRIPVFFRYNFIPGHPWIQPFIQAGLSFSLHHEYHYEYSNIQQPDSMFTSGDHSLYYHPGNDWGAQFRIGAIWTLNHRYSIETAINSYHTLDSYSPKESSNAYQPHIQSYRLVLGWILKI